MAYNTTKTLDKLTCTDYVDFGKCQDRFGRLSWFKNDSNYLDIKLKVFKRAGKIAEFRLRQNLSMGEADFRLMDNPDTSYAQVRLFGRKNEEEKFKQIVFVNYKLDEFIYLLDVMNSVYDKVIANQPICNVL